MSCDGCCVRGHKAGIGQSSDRRGAKAYEKAGEIAKEVKSFARRIISRGVKLIDVAEGIDAKIVEVGCLGLCCFEPLVVVHKPGSPQVCYGKVDPDKSASILEKYVLGGDPCAKWALGTMTPGKLDGIGKFSEHPMMTGQVRHVLRNCGVIDPVDMSHYLARDGYRGFLQALELGPDKTLEEVKKAGLRGRGGA